MLFVSRHLQTSRIRLDNFSILKTFLKIIYQYVIQHTSFAVLMLHIQIITIYFIVEHTFRNIHFGRFLLHGNKQSP